MTPSTMTPLDHADPAEATGRCRPRRQRGFSLLEILVAIVVLSIGLLGLAGLQANGLQANHSAI